MITNNLGADLSMAAGRGLCGTVYYGSQKRACEAGYIVGFSSADSRAAQCSTLYNRNYEQFACNQGSQWGREMKQVVGAIMRQNNTTHAG